MDEQTGNDAVTLARACRNAMIVVRTLAMSVVYASLAISTAGIAKAVWMLIGTIEGRVNH